MASDQQGLGVGVGDAAKAEAALEFRQVAFKLGAKRRVFDVVNLTLEALFRIVERQAAALGA